MSAAQAYALNVVFEVVRYFTLAGLAYWFFWVRTPVRAEPRRLGSVPRPRWMLRQEVRWSLSTTLVFAAASVLIVRLKEAGVTCIYDSIGERGWLYFFTSSALLVLVHDLYFYLVHRAMHSKLLFRHVHAVHHRFSEPSPFSTIAFHPLEALLQTLYMPVMCMLVPLHPAAIVGNAVLVTVMNIVGHLGFELFPSCFASHPILGWMNTATYHDLHHESVKRNLGLYFNHWDRLFGTCHDGYIARFESKTTQARAVPASSLEVIHV